MMQTLPKIMQIANLIQEKERGEEGKPKYIIWMNYSAQLPIIQRLLSSRRVLKSPPPPTPSPPSYINIREASLLILLIFSRSPILFAPSRFKSSSVTSPRHIVDSVT